MDSHNATKNIFASYDTCYIVSIIQSVRKHWWEHFYLTDEMTLSELVQHSRPRFWHYLFGPMLVLWAYRLATWVDSWVRVRYVVWSIFCLFVGNLFVYGINDVCDKDTDTFNTKKDEYERRVTHWSTTLLCRVAVVQVLYRMIIVGLWIVFDLLTVPMIWWSGVVLGLFYIFSRAYSSPPVRAKAHPFLDGITNVLYIVIPFGVYRVVSWTTIQTVSSTYIVSFASAWIRCIAMHCYSAIPDIEPDAKAWLTTTAVFFWLSRSLAYCAVLFLVAGIVASSVLGWIAIVLWVLYSVYVLLWYKYDIFMLYKYFPWINLIVGWVICFWVYFMF